FQLREPAAHVVDRGEVDGRILADRGMRAAAGLDPGNALDRQCAGPGQELRILAGIDIVGDDRDLVAIGEAAAQALQQGGLAGADRAADTDANGKAHDLNNLVSWVSCFMLHQSTVSDAAPRVSNDVAL